MPKPLSTEAAYAKYVAALQTALMHGVCTKPTMNKGQALRFRQMCYQIRSMYRKRNMGASPWDDIVINIDERTWTVNLVYDKLNSLMYDADGNVVDVASTFAMVKTLDSPEELYLTESDIEYMKEEAERKGVPFVMPNVKVVKDDPPAGDDILNSLG